MSADPVEETAERVRSCARRDGWSCRLRHQHVVAWCEALTGVLDGGWPLETPPAVRRRLDHAWRTGRGVRLTPDELRQICGGGGAS